MREAARKMRGNKVTALARKVISHVYFVEQLSEWDIE